ncbi:hypothetical protein J3F84DRAFT_384952 [Trichoderma pleuroticola]
MIIASEIVPSSSMCSLGDLLSDLHRPFANLHSTGNDAHFTLRYLLLLGAKSFTNTTTLN